MILKLIKRIQDNRRANILLKKRVVMNVKADLLRINAFFKEQEVEMRKNDMDQETKGNGVCPICDGKNVNDRMKKHVGSISGNTSGSSWSALTFGTSELSGSVNGSSDTKPINKCNDCDHEWDKYKLTYYSDWKLKRDCIDLVHKLLADNYKCDNCTFDPMDVDEKYMSLVDKRVALREDLKDWRFDSCKRLWNGTSIEAFVKLSEEAFPSTYYQYVHRKYYDEEFLLSLGMVKLRSK